MCVCVCVCMHIHTSHFLYPSIRWWMLRCFCVLAIVNNATMNITAVITVIWFPSAVVGLLVHVVVLFLVFWENFILFSIVAAPIYIPTNRVGGFTFLHNLHNTFISCLLVITVLTGVVLICISLIVSDVEHLFNTCWSLVCLLWEKFLPVFHWIFFWVFMHSSYISATNPLIESHLGFPGGSDGKESAFHSGRQETQVQSLSQEDPLEKGMTTHPSVLAWRIPWTEESEGVQKMGSQRVGHDWATNTHIVPLILGCFVCFIFAFIVFAISVKSKHIIVKDNIKGSGFSDVWVPGLIRFKVMNDSASRVKDGTDI